MYVISREKIICSSKYFLYDTHPWTAKSKLANKIESLYCSILIVVVQSRFLEKMLVLTISEALLFIE